MIRFVQALRFSGIFIFIGLLSCGHLSTPEYEPQGEYADAHEYMSQSESTQAADTTDNQYSGVRGPFQLRWPLKSLKVNQNYHQTGRRPHNGVDFGGRRGDPVYAAHDGVVVYAGRKFHGYGRMVLIEYDDNWATLYAHMNRLKVKTGQKVKAGKVVGTMGSSGRSTGVHLHFELLKNKIPVDPMPYLKAGIVTSL